MRLVEESELAAHLAHLVGRRPRIVVSGNFATPRALLGAVDRCLPSYRLWTLTGQPGLPDRDGVVHETPFAGPGVRDSERLDDIPARLSLVPRLFGRTCIPDSCCCTSPRRGRGRSRSASR